MKPIAILLVMSLVAGAAYAQTPQAKDSNEDVIAVVLGKKITVKDKDRLSDLIQRALLEQFAKENKIEPTEEELDAYFLMTEEAERQHQIEFEEDRKKLVAELKATTLSERERKDKESQLQRIESILKTTRERKEQTKGMEEQLRPMMRQMAHGFVINWKINKALYAKYGGRVIFEQVGPVPLDAYRDFLREQEKNGAFQILDKKYEAPFWLYFTNDAMHMFYSKEDAAKIINTPLWLMEEPPNE